MSGSRSFTIQVLILAVVLTASVLARAEGCGIRSALRDLSLPPITGASKADSRDVLEFVREQRIAGGYNPNRGADGRSVTKDLRNLDVAYSGSSGRMLMIKVDGKVKATTGFTRVNETTAEIKKVYADPSLPGAGRTLMEKAIREAREMGFSKVTLQTQPRMKSAINTYRKLGFVLDEQKSKRSVLYFDLNL